MHQTRVHRQLDSMLRYSACFSLSASNHCRCTKVPPINPSFKPHLHWMYLWIVMCRTLKQSYFYIGLLKPSGVFTGISFLRTTSAKTQIQPKTKSACHRRQHKRYADSPVMTPADGGMDDPRSTVLPKGHTPLATRARRLGFRRGIRCEQWQ